MVSKPKIGAWGLNWQHCHRVSYMVSHSYEQYYQAVRRCWRYGQQNPVTVDMITTESGANVLANLERKAVQADRMFDSLTKHMRNALSVQRSETYDQKVEVPVWARS
jgi:ribosome-associated toxin RatA of RatAB toxin-antitoxin module